MSNLFTAISAPVFHSLKAIMGPPGGDTEPWSKVCFFIGLGVTVAEQQQQPVLWEGSEAVLRCSRKAGPAVPVLTSLRSHGWSCVSRAQSVAGVTRAYLKRFWMAEDVQMYLYKNSFPVCSEMALADMANLVWMGKKPKIHQEQTCSGQELRITQLNTNPKPTKVFLLYVRS